MLHHIPSHHEIDEFMANQPGWNEIGLSNTHHIVCDIRDRMAQSAAYWQNWAQFVLNYIGWVRKYIEPLSGISDDSASTWEKWGEMVRRLHLGF